MYKKIVCLLLCMALSCLGAGSAFAEERALVRAEAAQVRAGEAVTISVGVENNPGIYSFRVALAYDPAVLTPVAESQQPGELAPAVVLMNPNPEGETGIVLVNGVSVNNMVGDGTLFSVQFTANADISEQTVTHIHIRVINMGGFVDEQTLATASIEAQGQSSDVTLRPASETEQPGGQGGPDEQQPIGPEGGGSSTEPGESTGQSGQDEPDVRPGEDAQLKMELKQNASSLRYIAPATQTAFEPDRSATRYEVIEALYHLFTFENVTGTAQFSDVDAPHQEMVAAFYQAGVIDGYTDGSFGGQKSITRAEFVKLLTEAFAVAIDTQSQAVEFSDMQSHWAKPYVTAFSGQGYIIGYPDGTFLPDTDVTRAEAVTIINRVLKFQEGTGAQQRFSDLKPEHWAYCAIMSAVIL